MGWSYLEILRKDIKAGPTDYPQFQRRFVIFSNSLVSIL
jgi:hypothetical protein